MFSSFQMYETRESERESLRGKMAEGTLRVGKEVAVRLHMIGRFTNVRQKLRSYSQIALFFTKNCYSIDLKTLVSISRNLFRPIQLWQLLSMVLTTRLQR